MKSRMLALAVAALGLIAAAPVQAALTMNGECGVITVPNAMTLPPLTFTAAADFVNTEDAMVPIRLEVGVIEGLEIGANYTWWDVEAVDYILGANAKYQIPIDLAEGLKIAVGGNYGRTATDADDFNAFAAYGVGSYSFELEGVALMASAGLDWERVSNGDSESGLGFMGAIEVTVIEGLQVAAEFGSENGDLNNDTTGFAVRYTLPMVPGLTVQAGLSDFASDDHEFFAGAQFAFGAQ